MNWGANRLMEGSPVVYNCERRAHPAQLHMIALPCSSFRLHPSKGRGQAGSWPRPLMSEQ
jgi:hypothetical protein